MGLFYVRNQMFWYSDCAKPIAAGYRTCVELYCLSCEEGRTSTYESIIKMHSIAFQNNQRSLTHGVAAAGNEKQRSQTQAESLHDAVVGR